MSVLNPAATNLLDKISQSKSVLIDKPRVMQVVGFVYDLATEVESGRLLGAAFYLSATGELQPAQILAHKGLTDPQKRDCLTLAALFVDAQAHRSTLQVAKDAIPV